MKKNILFISLGIIGLFLLIYWLLPIAVIDVYPKGTIDAFNGPIIVTFNKMVSPSDVILRFQPSVLGNIREGKKRNQIHFASNQPFDFSTTYVVEAIYKGKLIHSFSFQTPALSTDLETLRLNAQSVINNYPLAYLLPYKKDGYTIVYSAPLTLKVKYSSKKPPEEEIVSWINQKETELSHDVPDHKLEFVLVQ